MKIQIVSIASQVTNELDLFLSLCYLFAPPSIIFMHRAFACYVLLHMASLLNRMNFLFILIYLTTIYLLPVQLLYILS